MQSKKQAPKTKRSGARGGGVRARRQGRATGEWERRDWGPDARVCKTLQREEARGGGGVRSVLRASDRSDGTSRLAVGAKRKASALSFSLSLSNTIKNPTNKQNMEDFDEEARSQQHQPPPPSLDVFGSGAGEFLERLDGRRRNRNRSSSSNPASPHAAAATAAPGARTGKPTKKNRRAQQAPSWRDRLDDLMANMGGGLDDLGDGGGGSGGGGGGSAEGGSDDDGDGGVDGEGFDDDEQEEERRSGGDDDDKDEEHGNEQDEDEGRSVGGGDDDGDEQQDDDDDDDEAQPPPTAAAAQAPPATAPPTLDLDLSTPDVLERIEALCCRLLERLVRGGELPALQMLRAGGGAGGGGIGGGNGIGDGDGNENGGRGNHRGNGNRRTQNRPRRHQNAAAVSGASVELSEEEEDREDDGGGDGAAARGRPGRRRAARRSAAATTTTATTNTRDMTSRNGLGATGVARGGCFIGRVDSTKERRPLRRSCPLAANKRSTPPSPLPRPAQNQTTTT